VTIPIAVIGVSHETAPVEVRERLSFGPEEASSALLSLREEAGVEEAVLLSTCNRTEVYLFPARGEGALAAVQRVLAGRAGGESDRIEPYLFQAWGERAVEHLFEVSSGLDSLVTGEAEIQGQVKDAYRMAAALPVSPPMAGPVLNRLFQMALSVGGRVRAETAIGEGSASVASVAVELAGKIFGSLRGKRVLILGAGVMGELIVDALTRSGVQGILVANRTHERALALAERYRGHAIPMDRLQEAISTVDIVLCSTAAPQPVLTRSIVRESFREPRRHPLLIIDIAIPRDVDPAVGDEPGIFLYNVDDLRKIVDEHVQLREGAIPEASHLIRRQSEEFRVWYASLEVVPLIQELRGRADRVREEEVERLLRGMGPVDPAHRERIEEFARRLQNKLLHEPTSRLRRGLARGDGPEILDVARFLFGTDGEVEEEGDEPGPGGLPGQGSDGGPDEEGGEE